MTNSTAGPGQPLSLDEVSSPPDLPPLPDLTLRGPGQMTRWSADGALIEPNGAPAVDGLSVMSFDPATGTPSLVFVSDGLAAMLDCQPEDLIGKGPDVLLDAAEADEEMARLTAALGLPAVGPIDLASPDIDLAGPNGDGGGAPSTSIPTPPTTPTARTGSGPGVGSVATSATTSNTTSTATSTANGGSRLDSWSRPDTHGTAQPPGPAVRKPIQAKPPHPAGELKRYISTQTLRGPSGRRALAHVTFTTIPAASPAAAWPGAASPAALPSVVAEYRDLSRSSAENLLADQITVIAALSRGHELGRLCHQITAEVENQLGEGTQCLLAVVGPTARLEPVMSGDLTETEAMDLLRSMAETSARAGSDDVPTKILVPIDGLDHAQAGPLRERGINSLWYVPVPGTKGRSRGALLVLTPKPRPDRAITRTLDHLAAIMATAVEHATSASELGHQGLHDALTRLPNRALLVDRLDQAMGRLNRDGVSLSVLLVDIDRFRTVNDTRGVEVGDKVLMEVASRLMATVRLGDTVGRMASDQFLIMCVAASGELDAGALGRRVLRSLAEPIPVDDGDELHITASVGVVVVDQPGSTPASVISNAEAALARASASGRGKMAMYEAGLHRIVVDRHQTEQALHRAIDNDELVIHYQPLVEIRTGYMVGAEALVRWERPGHGLLYPPSFIQVAEESDLILPMGNWIIDKVCSDVGDWPKSNGRSPVVTINLAASQLVVDTLVPVVISALQRNDVHPNRVGFEITESMEMRDLQAAEINLDRLSGLGCRIAIDDFGIGHATLDYLRQFSVADALKIDRSFVAGLGKSREDTAIVNASIALAESLDMQVIAEGVETTEQLQALSDLGCRYAQGFGIAPPMPFDKVLERWTSARLYEPLRD